MEIYLLYLSYHHSVCFRVYYFLFIVYLFVGDYFAKKRYKTLLGWVLILIYLGIPLIMNKFVTILFYIGYQIKFFTSTRMPNDVYKTIQGLLTEQKTNDSKDIQRVNENETNSHFLQDETEAEQFLTYLKKKKKYSVEAWSN